MLSAGAEATDADPAEELRKWLIAAEAATPAPSSTVKPDLPLARLGRALFFSKQLSGSGDVACASCHHPLLGGGDALRLSIGVNATHPDIVGPGRQHDWLGSGRHDPRADGGPNVGRNAPTTFNTALYKRALLFDGRVEKLDTGGMRTPESHLGQADPTTTGASLLEAQSRFPVVSHDEMRGYQFVPHASGPEARAALASNLPEDEWLAAFAAAFPNTPRTAEDLLVFSNVAAALAAYQESQSFVNSPWTRYLRGETTALSKPAARGAALFYRPPSEGGAGCARCHRSAHFSDEQFHNLAIPQFGRGTGAWGSDLGRYRVTGDPRDRYAFRTPSLLNVAMTAPYGHTGAYSTLAEIIRHHLDPERAIAQFDFDAASADLGSEVVYSRAREHTRDALRSMTGLLAKPTRRFTETDVSDLVAFMHALTDPCTQDGLCMSPWIPEPQAGSATQPLAANNGRGQALREVAVKAAEPITVDAGPLTPRFAEVSEQVGVRFDTGFRQASFEMAYRQARFGLGVAVGDIDGDGDLDLFVDRGDVGSTLMFENNGSGGFSEVSTQVGVSLPGTGGKPALVDLNGDGHLDLFVAPLTGQARVLLGRTTRDIGAEPVTRFRPHSSGIEVTRPISSAAFADVDRDGDLDILLGHFGTHATAPQQHLWLNDGDGRFVPGARSARLRAMLPLDERVLSTRAADINGDDWPDLLVVGDDQNSRVLINQRNGTFADETDVRQLDLKTAAGQALGDIDNDGDLDWYLASVWDPADVQGSGVRETGDAAGQQINPRTGNVWTTGGGRLLVNHSGSYTDATGVAGVADTFWSAGSCMADFNNDSHLDLYVVNGMPAFHPSVATRYRRFEQNPARLYLSRGDGTFDERAAEARVADQAVGRALACVDIDSDGDVDIVSLTHAGPRIYRNTLSRQIHKRHQALTVVLHGPSSNPHAIGARVQLLRAEKVLRRDKFGAAGFASHGSAPLHFGLGEQWEIDQLQVHWADAHGTVTRINRPNPQHRIVITYTPTAPPPSTALNKAGSVAPTNAVHTPTPQATPRAPDTTIDREARARTVFSDVTTNAGLNGLSQPVAPSRHMQPYLTGGVALGDFDADGWTDIYLPRTNGRATLMRNVEGRFVDVTDAAFGPNHLTGVRPSGATWGDIDNDGDLDLYVTSIFSNRYHLFLNDGKGRFEEVAQARGVAQHNDAPHFGFSAIFADYDVDGDLDLYTTEWRLSTQLQGSAPSNARLFRNDGTGHFTDVTRFAGVSMTGLKATMTHALEQSFSAHFTDMDADGFPDLLVASDNGTSRLFWNNGNGTFRDGTELAGVGTDQYGMGSDVADFDGDGDFDWFVTSIYQPDSPNFNGNRLYRNAGNRRFVDATEATGVRDAGWGWASKFFDFDNDGDLDLLATNGIAMSAQFHPPLYAYRHAQDATRVWENVGGTFHEVADDVGVKHSGQGRGIAVFDYDRDGDQDFVVVNNDGTVRLYRNELAPGDQHVRIRLQGQSANRRGIGAIIRLTARAGDRPVLRTIGAGNNFLSQSEAVAHFGIDDAPKSLHQIEVIWPGGDKQILKNVSRRAEMVIVQGQGLAAPYPDGSAAVTPELVHSSHIVGRRDRSSVPRYHWSIAP